MPSRIRILATVLTVSLTATFLGFGAGVASAGSQVTTNSCQNSATGTFADIDFTHTGAATPNPVTLGTVPVTLSGAAVSADFPAAVLIAGYNLGLLTLGLNVIPGTMDVTLLGSNTAEGSQAFNGIVISGETTISDPDGTPGNGDESATPLTVSLTLPDSTWTPTGGEIRLSDGGSTTIASVFNGLIKVKFTCEPGTSTPAGCADDIATDCTGRAPSGASPFDAIVVSPGTPTTTTTSPPATTTTYPTTVPPTTSTTTSPPTTTSTTEPPSTTTEPPSTTTEPPSTTTEPPSTTTEPPSTTTTIVASETGTLTTVNSCQNSATGTFSDINFTFSGTASGDVLLESASVSAEFPSAVLIAGYNLGLLDLGLNVIPGTMDVRVIGSNTVEGSQTFTEIPISGETTIGDPDGTAGTGDETATPLVVAIDLPDSTWTPTGGDIVFSDGGSTTTASVFNGLIKVKFTCEPGTSTPAGCADDIATDCTDRDPVPAGGFVTRSHSGTPSSSTTTTTTTVAGPTTTSGGSTTTTVAGSTTTTSLGVLVGSGTSSFTTTCSNNATPDPSEIRWTGRGSSQTVFVAGDTVDLKNQRWNVTVNGSTFDTGINLGLISFGDTVNSTVDVTIHASNTVEGSRTHTGIAISVPVELGDDGLAKDQTTSFRVPNSTWTATGTPIIWTPGNTSLAVIIPVLPAPLVFTCIIDPGAAPILNTDAPQVLGESLAFTGSRGWGILLPIALSLILLDLGYMAWSATRSTRRRRFI